MKHFTALSIALALTLCLSPQGEAKEPPQAEAAGVLQFKMKSLDGREIDLSKYRGKTVLIVNVASKCGLTPQYKGLQALHEKYGKQGLVVLGFPCNQFGKQEPGTSKQIAAFCQENYGVTFAMFEKIAVNGEEACPLYKFLTSPKTNPKFAGPIKWNFTKFLISRDGRIAARFEPRVQPQADNIVKAIERELEKKK